MRTTTYKPDVSVMVLGMALTVVFPLVLSMFIVSFLPGDFSKILLSRAMFWAELCFITLYARKMERQPLLLWSPPKYPWYFYVFWAMVISIGVFVAFILSAIPGILGWKENSVLLTYWFNIITSNWWLLLLCALTPAVTEELLSRGYLLSRFQVLFNSKVLPVVLSALLFSNLHLKLFSLRETLFSFMLGLIFGFHYQRYHNIYVLMLVRFLINVTLFVLFREGLLKLRY